MKKKQIKEIDERFEDFLCVRNDELDNAAHSLLNLMASPDSNANPVPWDMEMIGELLEDISSILEKKGFQTCWPFYAGDNETPCWREEGCKRTDCPLRPKEGAV